MGDLAMQAVGNVLNDAIKRLYEGLLRQVPPLIDKAKLEGLISGFEVYAHNTRMRCSWVKTIVNRSAPVELHKAYVPLRVIRQQEVLDEAGVLAMLGRGQQVVITGGAGCGKSMLMRSLFLKLLERGDTVPVYVELRNAEVSDELSLSQYICHEIGMFTNGFSQEALAYGLDKRHIYLLLDGFDEVQSDRKGLVEKQLLQMVYSCPNMAIAVSGRRDLRYSAWPTFHELRVQGLDRQQVGDLLQRVEYDAGIKSEFAGRAMGDLYQSHHDLVSSPLLCCLMLMTYGEFRAMPSKMHVFYDTAFEVLARKFDATKPQFIREFYTGLELGDFTRLFETFCLVSYIQDRVAFENGEIEKFAAESIEYERGVLPAVEVGDFVNDLIENVCVILPDGDRHAFLHRSFQEYFVASFLTSRSPPRLFEMTRKIVQSNMVQGVFGFALDLNREVMQREFVPKAIAEMLAVLDAKEDRRSKILKFFAGFDVYESGRVDVYWSGRDALARSLFSVLDAVGDQHFLREPAGAELIADLPFEHGINDLAGERYIRIDRSNPAMFDRMVDEMRVEQAIRTHLGAAGKKAQGAIAERLSAVDGLLGGASLAALPSVPSRTSADGENLPPSA